MRLARKVILTVSILALVVLGGAALSPDPASAGICEEGTWQEEKMHCQLGFHTNCTECWVF